jgi:hypothetical protein
MFTGKVPKAATAIEAYLRVMENIEPERLAEGNKRVPRKIGPWAREEVGRAALGEALTSGNRDSVKAAAREAIEKPLNGFLNAAKKVGGAADRYTASFFERAQALKRLIPDAPEIQKNAAESETAQKSMVDSGSHLTEKLLRAEKADKANMDKWATVVNEAARLGFRPDEPLKPLSVEKQKLATAGKFEPHMANANEWVQRDEHSRLAKEYRAVVAVQPELADLTDKVFSFTKERKLAEIKSVIDNIIHDSGHSLEAKDYAILKTELSKEHAPGWALAKARKLLGEEAVSEIVQKRSTGGASGVYLPAFRRGDTVVGGVYKLDFEPSKALRETNGKTGKDATTFDFENAKDAHEFVVKNKRFSPRVLEKFYDAETGEAVTRLDADTSDPENSRKAYQVQLERRHVEFADSSDAAHKIAAELKKGGELIEDPYVEPRDEFYQSGHIDKRAIDRGVNRIKKSQRYDAADKETKEELVRAVRETLVREALGHRVRGIQRRGVRGASDDLIAAVDNFNHTSATSIARAKFDPKTDALLRRADIEIKKQRYDADGNLDPQNEARRAGLQELSTLANQTHSQTSKIDKILNGVKAASYAEYLLSPAYLALKLTNTGMTSIPYIAGRYGYARAAKTIFGHMRMFGDMPIKGLQDAVGTAKGMLEGVPHRATNFVELAKGTLANKLPAEEFKRVSKALDELAKLGILDMQSGFETEAYRTNSKNPVLRGAMIVDQSYRRAVDGFESLNRIAVATGVYKLEYAKLREDGKTTDDAHSAAIAKANDVLNRTEGAFNYSNASPLMKNRFVRPFMQFKQWPLLMYRLFGGLARDALTGESKEVRIEAAKSLAYMLATIGVVGGISELPTEEPLKVIGAALKIAGVTGSDWADVKRSAHELLAKEFGKNAAGYAMHGFGGLLGIDIASRVGMGNAILGFFPEGKYSTEKWAKWAIELEGGAPGSAAFAMAAGTKNLAGQIATGLSGGGFDGEKFVEDFSKAVPVAALRNAFKAYRGETPDKQVKMNVAERASQAFGFTPESVADHWSRVREMKALKEEHQDQRQTLMYGYADAKNAGERLKAKAKIDRWNAGQPPMARLSMDALNSAVRSKQNKEHEDVRHHLGQSFNKSDTWIASRDINLYGEK